MVKVLSRKPDLGGALYVRGWKNGTRPTLTVNGTVFSGNKAGFAGGSLFVETMASLEMSEITLDSSHTIVGPGELLSILVHTSTICYLVNVVKPRYASV